MTKSFVKIHILGWQSTISGVIIQENIDWIILQFNPVDYVLDGFVVINKSHIEKIVIGDEEKFKLDVIKCCDKFEFPNLSLDSYDIKTVIGKICSIYRLIGIYKELDDEIHVGLFSKNLNDGICLFPVNPRGELDSKETIQFESIRVIEFNNDYLNSLNNYIISKGFSNL